MATLIAKIEQDVKIHQGDYAELVFLTYDKAGNLVDISGAVIAYEVNKGPHAAGNYFDKSVGSGVTIAPDQAANKGQWTVQIDPIDTQDLEGELRHEGSMSLNSKPMTAMTGEFEILPSRQR